MIVNPLKNQEMRMRYLLKKNSTDAPVTRRFQNSSTSWLSVMKYSNARRAVKERKRETAVRRTGCAGTGRSTHRQCRTRSSFR